MLATKETLSHGYAILYLVFVIIISFFDIVWASLVAQMVKNPPAIQETWVPSLGWEDPLEEGMASHSGILAWRIPMDRGARWARVHGVAKSPTQLSTAQKFISC